MIAAVSLACISLLVFANTLNHPFVHDEIVFIVQNHSIARWDDLARLFLGGHDPAAPGINTYYRPLLEIVYKLEYALWGLNPWGWHFFNALLHGVNGVLVYRMLGVLGFGGLLPWTAALLFTVHPVQTESVACVAGVSNLVMAFFVLSSLIFYLKDKFILAVLCLLAGLLAKEQAVMAVPLIVLVDWYRGRKPYAAWAISILGIGLFLVGRQALTGAHVLSDILASTGELKLRVAAIGETLMNYVRIIFIPNDLHYYRSTDILAANSWWWVMVLAIGAAVVKSDRAVRFGSLWFVLALLPVLNIVPLINEYSLILTAEHFLYLPLAGIAIVFCTIGAKFPVASKTRRNILILTVAILAALTLKQNKFWKSETILFERTMAYEPSFGRGHLLLAKAYYFEGSYAQAEEHFAQAYNIMNGYAHKAYGEGPRRFYLGFVKGILFDWAHALESRGFLAQAAAKYEEAIMIDPQDPVLRNNLQVLRMKIR